MPTSPSHPIGRGREHPWTESSSGSIPTSCRPRSRSSTNERTLWGRAGSPPTRPASRQCASTSSSGQTGSGAIEGSLGVGRPLAQRLLEAGERVVDVPAKLAARARLLDTGHGRKTDAHDAHSVAVAAVRSKELRVDATTRTGTAEERDQATPRDR